MNIRTQLIAIGAVLACVHAAHAGPLLITESTDFGSVAGPSLGVLDVGLNVISGQVSGALFQNLTQGDPLDVVSLQLQAGQAVASWSLRITGYQSGAGGGNAGYFLPFGGIGPGRTISGNTTINSAPNYELDVAGIYNFQVYSPYSATVVNVAPPGQPDDIQTILRSGALSYSLSLNVISTAASDVPEPSTWGLVLAALGSLCALRRNGPLGMTDRIGRNCTLAR